jgi:hypothetical protein
MSECRPCDPEYRYYCGTSRCRFLQELIVSHLTTYSSTETTLCYVQLLHTQNNRTCKRHHTLYFATLHRPGILQSTLLTSGLTWKLCNALPGWTRRTCHSSHHTRLFKRQISRNGISRARRSSTRKIHETAPSRTSDQTTGSDHCALADSGQDYRSRHDQDCERPSEQRIATSDAWRERNRIEG